MLGELVARLARRPSDGGGVTQTISSFAEDVTRLRLALGCLESRNVRVARFDDPRQAEFQVFSQWEEDGIIQCLLGKVPIAETTFVEFGVADCAESKKRFLLCNDNRRGLVIVECNSLFGSRAAVSVPYRAGYRRSRAHYSNLYYGASLAALCHWASRNDYSLVCTNSAGNNAFFVRNDVRGELRPLSPEEGWVSSRFRESRDQEGALTYLSSQAERLRLIADLPIVDVTSGRQAKIGDFQLG